MDINTIYNENCLATLERMEEKNGFDFIITSPPYNTNVKANAKRNVLTAKVKEKCYTYARYDGYDDSRTNEEYCEFIANLFKKIDEKMKPNGCVLWNASYGNENADALFLSLATIINKGFSIADVISWKKTCAMPNTSSSNKATRICEFVFVICRNYELKTFRSNKKESGRRADGQMMYIPFTNFIEAKNNDGSNPYNKATFSIEFVQKLLNLYVGGGIVYDPFMGTGTTAVACKKMGINYIGSELSQNQVQYALKRIKEECCQLSLF
jgi:DNA modification methylase